MAALEAYFHGKQRMTNLTTVALAEAVDYFEQAIELDPNFALAYVELAEQLSSSKSISAAYRALKWSQKPNRSSTGHWSWTVSRVRLIPRLGAFMLKEMNSSVPKQRINVPWN